MSVLNSAEWTSEWHVKNEELQYFLLTEESSSEKLPFSCVQGKIKKYVVTCLLLLQHTTLEHN